MAVTQDSFTGNGSKTDYDFTFPYLKQSEIKASLDGTPTTNFRHLTATKIQFVNNTTDNTPTAPAADVKIKIYRETDTTSLAATFYAGSAIKSEDLNDNFTQNIYATQEVSERYLSNLGGTMTGDLNLGEDVIVKFEGASDNAHETTLTVADPTADRTITLPNETGTVITTASTGQVATSMIAGDAVNGDKIADNAINSEHYTDGSIDHEHLANDVIDGDNIQDDVINSEHIAAGALDTEHYAANSVDAAALAHTSVTAGTYTAADITVDAQGRLTAAASGTIARSEIAADAIDGTKIADNAINSEHYTDGSIDREHLAADIVDGSKIADDSLNSEHYVAGSIDHEHLANDIIDGDNIADDVVNSEHIAAGAVDLEHMSANSVDSDQYVDGSIDRIHLEADIIDATKIADNAVTTDHIQDAELTTLAGMQSGTASILADSTALTATTAELNILDNKTFRASGDGTLTTTSDTEMPSSKVIATHVASSITAVGGFKSIADEVSFPTTANMPATGVAVSINNAAGVVVNGSGVSTTGRTTDGTPATVTINGFPSSLYGETLAAGVGLIVQATSTANTYTYHKLLASETDVKQLSDDINDFNARYRVAGSAPGSNNDAGDLYFDTGAGKMKVYNGTTSTWDDVASVGNFYINTISSSSGTGGGSSTFNGSAYRFTLSNPPTMAQQLIVSVNGVIQKPNAGSSQPSEGFAISGNDIIFSAAPASSSDYFIVTQGSSVSIGTPSDNTVSTAKIQNQAVNSAKIQDASIVNGDIADDTIAEVKLDIHNAPATDKYLKYTSNGMEWSDGASEGTDVKSTGESGTTKFLRVDGDGTSSWQVPPDTTYSVQDGQLSQNNFTDTLKTKLDGVAASANNYAISTDLLDEDNMSSNSSTKVPSQQSVKAYVDTQVGGISAAPEITGTASGSISNNAAVIVKTNGQIEAVTATTSIASTPTGTMISAGVDTTDNSYWQCSAYDESENCLMVLWGGTSNFNGFKIRTGVVSASSISWGTTQHITSDANYAIREIHIAASGSGKLAVFFAKNSGSQLYMKIANISASNKNVDFGNTTSLGGNGYSGTSGVYMSEPVWMSSSTLACAWRKGGTERGYVKTFSVSGQNCTVQSEHEIANDSHRLDGQVGLIYRNNKLVFFARRIHPGNNLLLKCASISGTSMSWGSVRTDSVIAYKVQKKSATFIADDKFIVAFTDTYNEVNWSRVFSISTTTIDTGGTVANYTTNSTSNTQLYWDSDISRVVMSTRNTDSYDGVHFQMASISGTSITWGTESAKIRNTTNNSDVRETYSFVYDSTLERGLIVANADSGDNTTYDISVFSADTTTTTTNMTADNFVGFSTAGYSNGQTATVAVVGNTTTKSSLTAGSKYYVQKDGSLATTAITPSVEAGLALTSTKLLIK